MATSWPGLFVVCALLASVHACNLLQTSSYISAFEGLKACSTGQGDVNIDYTQFASLLGSTLDLSTCTDLASCSALVTQFGSTTTNDEMKDLSSKLTSPDTQAGACACLSTAAPLLDNCISVIDALHSDFCLRFLQSPTLSATKAPATAISNPGFKSCDAAITSMCKLDTLPSFNESFSCIRDHLVALETDCALMLDVFVAGIYRGCAVDIVSSCQSSFSANSPARTMACLAWNYRTLTSQCRAQLEGLAGNVLPCASEAAQYCPDKLLPEDVFQCLSQADVAHGSVSATCEDMIVGFSQCKDTIQDLLPGGAVSDGGGQGGQDSEGPPGGEGEGPRGTGDGGPKSKPGDKGGKGKPKAGSGGGGKGGVPSKASPDALPRGRQHQMRRLQDQDQKPKPRPGQNGAGTKPRKPQPGNDGAGGGGGKSKPGPGGKGGGGGGGGAGGAKQKPCWQRLGQKGKGKPNNGFDSDRSQDGSAEQAANGSSQRGKRANDDAAPGPPPGPNLVPPILLATLCAAVVAALVYRARDKIHEALSRWGLMGPASQQHADSQDVELSAYSRAPEEETDIDSSSHPLSKKDEGAVEASAAVVVAANQVQM